jgi:hypothetical protein
MAVEDMNGLMAGATKETGWMGKSMAKGFTLGKMAKDTKENIKTIKYVGQVFI